MAEGPFPTELPDEWGDLLRKPVASSARRPDDRGAPAVDAPIARYAARINGVTDFVLTKVDILTGSRASLSVCYEVDGERVDEMPMTQRDFAVAMQIL